MRFKVQRYLFLSLVVVALSAMVFLVIALDDKSSVVAGVVPHHSVADDMIDNFFIELKKEAPLVKTLVIVGQDHYNQLSTHIVTGQIGKTNYELLEDVKNYGINDATVAIGKEHSFTELIPFISQHLPEVSVLPLMHTGEISKQELDELSQFLVKVTDENTIFLVSTDFSHYLHENATRFHDLRTIDIFANFEEESLPTIEGDLWQSLYLVRKIAELKGANQFKLLDYDVTSSYFTETIEDNVGYVSGFLLKGGAPSTERTATLIFTGEMDFDSTTYEDDKYYPFRKVHALLRGVDLAIGHLDGGSISAETARVFKEVYFYGLNIQDATPETQENLGEVDLKILPYQTTIGGKSIALLSYFFENPEFSNDQMLTDIAQASSQNDFVAVQIDWGEIGSLAPTLDQQKQAYAMVDNGADLIIGQGSSRVKDYEIYNGKAIFYSIGKLISVENLAVGVALKNEKTEIFVFPLTLDDGQVEMSYTSSRSEIFTLE
ncbi:MAG: AmmeMemoRadiSam system protein B [Candidatus Gracilibacteria bacterium]